MPSDRIASPTQLRLHEEHLERRKRLMAMPRLSPPKVVSRPISWVAPPPEPVVLEMYGPPAPPPKPTVRSILKEVAKKHGVGPRDIIGGSRSAHIVAARHEVCWRLRHEVTVGGRPISLPMIGKKLGRRDHTTIRNAILAYEAKHYV